MDNLLYEILKFNDFEKFELFSEIIYRIKFSNFDYESKFVIENKIMILEDILNKDIEEFMDIKAKFLLTDEDYEKSDLVKQEDQILEYLRIKNILWDYIYI